MKHREIIAVLGAGWLGLPLVGDLLERGYPTVRASYRREAVRSGLLDQGANPFLLDLPSLSGPLEAFLQDCSALVITLPPGGRQFGDRALAVYLDALAPLADFLPQLHVVYTSSTGVYGSTVEGPVTEATPTAPDTPSSRAVVAAEEWLAARTQRLTILRLAGLYGPGRDPGTFFSAGQSVPLGDAPVNMLHQADAVSAIQCVLASGATGVFNVCAAAHPTKKTFYTAMSHRAGRTVPIFVGGRSSGKIVDSSALRTLGWQPQHDGLDLP